MVGIKCRNACKQIRLECAAVEIKTDCDGETFVPTPSPTPSRTCKDKTLNTGKFWSNKDINMCYDYIRYSSWYIRFGSEYRNNFTANEACCACGGGNRS